MAKTFLKYCSISILFALASCSTISQNSKSSLQIKSSTVYQVTSEAPTIDDGSISQLSNRDVGNIQGISDYLSSAFLKITRNPPVTERSRSGLGIFLLLPKY